MIESILAPIVCDAFTMIVLTFWASVIKAS